MREFRDKLYLSLPADLLAAIKFITVVNKKTRE
jgi:hypothetical protein